MSPRACMRPFVSRSQVSQICIQNTRLSLVEECRALCPAGGCAWMNEPPEQEHAGKTFTPISAVVGEDK